MAKTILHSFFETQCSYTPRSFSVHFFTTFRTMLNVVCYVPRLGNVNFKNMLHKLLAKDLVCWADTSSL